MAFTYQGQKVDLDFGRGWLDVGPAASIRRIDRQIGHPLQITEAGRTWLRQNEHWLKYQRDGWPIALNPNTPSEHQKGKSVDSDEAQRIQQIMEDNGWRRTVYRWVNGVWTLVERWHYEYFAHLDKHINDKVPAVQPVEEDEEMSIPVLLNGTHMYHIKFGGIKHLHNNKTVAGYQNNGPAHVTMQMVSSVDKWIPLNSNEFLEQLDNWHIPRSVVDLKTGFDVSLADEKNPKGKFVSGGAWEWARAAYANTLVEKPVPRY
ncbi:MAG: hypothetical protein RR853_08780 [Aurantimicrobium sp.]|uniref:hypothetical protein n=1 Tax=Aurantimicrobium sp. TaxID=1930784 RepID=UPI002FCB2A1A